jgi:DNA-binding transcriptional ArsR family regulator
MGQADRVGAEVPEPGAAGVTASLAAAPIFSLFSALGDRNRLRIVVRLCDGGPSSTSQVTQAVSVTRQAATKHLELLEAAGLVSSSRRGRERIWTLQTRQLIDAGDYLNQLSRRWDAAIDRLRAYVED